VVITYRFAAMSTPSQIARSTTDASRAVVIGAGMAGLLAARVLSDFFAEVVLVERDRLPDRPQFRPGVPQAAHGHVLLVGGVRTINDLFPGIERQLNDAGATSGDVCNDAIVVVRGRQLPRFPSNLRGMLLSRNLLEWQVRQRLGEHANVTIRPECRVTGLIHDAAVSRVTGIRVAAPGEAVTEIVADVVVDASGARSVTSAWLAESGIATVPETVVDARVGYASRRFRRPANWSEDWKVAAISWQPPTNRCAGGVYPEENGIWVASLVGALEDIPKTTEDHFLAHARQLEDPVLYDLIRDSEPVSKIAGYRLLGNRRRRYSGLSKRLGRLIVIGDALCTINAFYGQGMTIAALEARALQAQFSGVALDDAPAVDRAVRRAQRACETVLTIPWLFSTTEDFRHGTGVEGVRTLTHRVASWYVDRALQVRSERITLAIFRTMGMVDPYALFRPRVLIEVLLMSALRQIGSVLGRHGPQESATMDNR